jgi:oxygen-dependent protoporphyrinogen oxidase
VTVLVVGGGISGLAAAHELSLAGIPALVVEAEDRLGGKIATERVDGFTIEHGPDSMLATRPAGVALARAVGLGGDLVGVQEPRLVHILRDGRPIPMPDGLGLILPTKVRPFVGTRLFSWPEKARMALDLVLPRVMAAGDEPVGAYLRRRLGSALVDRLPGPLVGGI